LQFLELLCTLTELTGAEQLSGCGCNEVVAGVRGGRTDVDPQQVLMAAAAQESWTADPCSTASQSGLVKVDGARVQPRGNAPWRSRRKTTATYRNNQSINLYLHQVKQPYK